MNEFIGFFLFCVIAGGLVYYFGFKKKGIKLKDVFAGRKPPLDTDKK